MSSDDLINLLRQIGAKTKGGDGNDLKTNRYTISERELQAELIHYCLQYLNVNFCLPSYLLEYIVQGVTEMKFKLNDLDCKLESNGNYDSYKISLCVMNFINEICNRTIDSNSQLNQILSLKRLEDCFLDYSVYSDRNVRRYHEDRYVVINDLNRIFNVNDNDIASFYGIFDGHDGYLAAAYSAIHLPFQLASDPNYIDEPVKAIQNAYNAVDSAFNVKCKEQKLKGGTTALCAIYRPKEMRLYVSWVGDSRALLIKRNEIIDIVRPHKPKDQAEAERIKSLGGTVMKWQGLWRVNGLIAVSRAIGDLNYKPYISSEPDIVCIDFDETEDFLILACDGLWDNVKDEEVSTFLYEHLIENITNSQRIAEKLVELAKHKGSSDNITIIVVFLKTPKQIADGYLSRKLLLQSSSKINQKT